MIKIEDIRRYQEKMHTVRLNGFKASDYKALGRELQEEFDLSVPEVTAILNDRHKEILEILEKHAKQE